MLSGMSENDRLSSSSRGALEAKTLKHAALDNINKAMNVLCPEYRHVGHSNAAATAVSFRSQSVLLGHIAHRRQFFAGSCVFRDAVALATN